MCVCVSVLYVCVCVCVCVCMAGGGRVGNVSPKKERGAQRTTQALSDSEGLFKGLLRDTRAGEGKLHGGPLVA